jgi:hypothetical protein
MRTIPPRLNDFSLPSAIHARTCPEEYVPDTRAFEMTCIHSRLFFFIQPTENQQNYFRENTGMNHTQGGPGISDGFLYGGSIGYILSQTG